MSFANEKDNIPEHLSNPTRSAREVAETASALNEDVNHKTDQFDEDMPQASKHRPSFWRSDEPLQFGLLRAGDPWETCLNLAQEHDAKMCDSWTDEVQNLLIFAGLFSAVVTAFAVESYKLLQENPADISATLLAQLTTHLILQNTPNISSSVLIALPLPQPFVSGAVPIAINIFWFVSLTLSLTTVLVGTLCMQWLREYRKYEPLPSKEAFVLRQMRYNGLVYWGVPRIFSWLPGLLQAALVFFFVGLVTFLWRLNSTVAIVLAILVAILMVFLFATTIAPTIQYLFAFNSQIPHCPYKSPQSWAIYQASLRFLTVLTLIKQRMWSNTERAMPQDFTLPSFSQAKTWFRHDLLWSRTQYRTITSYFVLHRDVASGLQWVAETFLESVSAVDAVFDCIRDLDPREALAVYSTMRFDDPDRMSEVIQDCNWDGQLLRDTVSLFVLDHFEEKRPQLYHRHYLPLRLELNVRIKAFANALMTLIGNSKVVRCPTLHRTSTPAVPIEATIQQLKITCMLIESDVNCESDVNASWHLLQHTIRKYAPNPDLGEHLAAALDTAMSHFLTLVGPWASSQADSSIRDEHRRRCTSEINYLWNVPWKDEISTNVFEKTQMAAVLLAESFVRDTVNPELSSHILRIRSVQNQSSS